MFVLANFSFKVAYRQLLTNAQNDSPLFQEGSDVGQIRPALSMSVRYAANEQLLNKKNMKRIVELLSSLFSSLIKLVTYVEYHSVPLSL